MPTYVLCFPLFTLYLYLLFQFPSPPSRLEPSFSFHGNYYIFSSAKLVNAQRLSRSFLAELYLFIFPIGPSPYCHSSHLWWIQQSCYYRTYCSKEADTKKKKVIWSPCCLAGLNSSRRCASLWSDLAHLVEAVGAPVLWAFFFFTFTRKIGCIHQKKPVKYSEWSSSLVGGGPVTKEAGSSLNSPPCLKFTIERNRQSCQHVGGLWSDDGVKSWTWLGLTELTHCSSFFSHFISSLIWAPGRWGCSLNFISYKYN